MLPLRVLGALRGSADNSAQEAAMRIRVNDPHAADDLRSALEAAECVAARTADDTLEVELPPGDPFGDARQALLELAFFVKAWEANRPGVAAVVTA